MYKLNRRGFMLSTAALAASTGLVGRAVSADSGTIRILMAGGDADLANTNNAIARFNKKFPNFQVSVDMDPIATGWGDYVTKVIAEFAANNQHDIFGTAIETFQTFASRGLVEPIDDFVAKNPNYSDFAPALFEDCKYKGKTYFVPTSWNNIMIHYNRDHFDKAGIAYPKAGWTWDEFRDIAKKLTIKDSSGTVTQWGYEVPNQNFFLQPWLFSNGTGALNDDWSASNMLDPKVAESLQFLHDIIHVDGSAPIPGSATMDNEYLAGQVSMINRGHWVIPNIRNAKLNSDVAIPPSKVNDYTVVGFGAVGIAKGAQNMDAVQAMVAELTGPEAEADVAKSGSAVPGSKAAAELPEYLAFPPSAPLFYATLPHTKAVPSPANFQEVEKIFIRYYTAVMADEMPVADACKQADAELNDSFARLKASLGQS
jgi:multiple sugar transport system substrate-binding protein